MSKQFSYTALLMVIVQVLFSLYAKADDDLVRYKLEAQTVAGKPIAPNSSISCLLYTSPSPRDLSTSRMPSSA